MIFFLFPLLVIVSGCAYPNYQIQKLDDLSFENKRLDNITLQAQDFIKPQETADIVHNLTCGTEDEILLNTLNYVQNLPLVNDTREFWQYPNETIKKGGDCEDKTFLLLSMLVQAEVKDTLGVKGIYLGQGHMWVEYKGYILDPSRKTTKLIPIEKSTGYVPYFKFNNYNSYFCNTERGNT